MTAVVPTARSTQIRPAGWWFALCPIIVVIGIALAIGQGIDEWDRASGTYEKLGSDGKATIQLQAGEQRTVFAVFGSTQSTDSLSVPSGEITVTGPDGPIAVDKQLGSSRETWNFGDDAGIKAGSFEAPTSGQYTVTVRWTGVLAGASSAIPGAAPQAAIGDFDIVGAIGRTLAPAGLGAGIAFALLISLVVMRAGSKRRIRNSKSTPTPLGIPSTAMPHESATGHSGPFV